ncbi:hypothetical protein AB0M46_43915 [Dactylosporangium sp. NPDC051485]|uniref:hypothetical protein n=1 Tax=Dactylosporangium sp. NPDC051485 TaxID=3154846 RepID=UPI0034198760
MTTQRLRRLTVYTLATEAEEDAIRERIRAALCPDPDHDGPCPNPWLLIVTDSESLDEEEAAAMMEALLD